MTCSARHAAALAAFSTLACAAGQGSAHGGEAALRAELAAARERSDALERRLDELSVRVDALSARLRRPADAASASEPLVPRDLAVVKLDPARVATPRTARRPPSLPTAVSIREPEPEELDALGSGRGDLAAEAAAELSRSRALSGLARARALSSFAARYPRHPQADNALREAADDYAAAGDVDAACKLVARCVDEYPAGDALPDALEALGECRARRGDEAAARALFERVLADFPRTPAAERAGRRIASLSARDAPPPDGSRTKEPP